MAFHKKISISLITLTNLFINLSCLNYDLYFTSKNDNGNTIDAFNKIFNTELYENECIRANYTAICNEYVSDLVNRFAPIDPESGALSENELQYNKLISSIYFIKGDIDYLGIFENNPNLLSGLIHFIISGYIGNSESLYKLYFLLETEIYTFYYTKLQNALSTYPLLKSILIDKDYLSNFNFNDKTEKQSLSNLLLYTSTLDKNINSINALAYKYNKGFGVKKDCLISKQYYKESSNEIINYYLKINKPNYYDKFNIAAKEYVGYKYISSESNLDVSQIIEYLKTDAEKGLTSTINHIGERFLYGQGINQDFYQALYYFDKGSNLNNSMSSYYLGELYLNGWGVEKNYTKAYDLYKKSLSIDETHSKSLNSLGYMYYFGLGVEKNIKKAYDYFTKATKFNVDDADAFFNLVTLLTEDNGSIQVDISTAHKYASIIASKGHTFGTYYLANMVEYKLGSTIDECEVNIQFYRSVAEKSMESKRKFDLAYKFYISGKVRSAALIYLELAEEGHLFAEVNAGILLNNYGIFTDNKFNKMMSHKYLERSSSTSLHSNSGISLIYLADLYFKGNDYIQKDLSKAYEYYTKAIKFSSGDKQIQSHAYFNMGYMNYLGYGNERNLTKFDHYLNLTIKYDPDYYIPSKVMKLYANLEKVSYEDIINFATENLSGIINPVSTVLLIVLIVFYLLFYLSLIIQK